MKAIKTRIQRGAVIMTDKLRELIQSHEGQEVLIEINKLPLKRSLAQNKYFHGMIIPYYQKMFSIERYVTDEQTKIELKQMFLPIEIFDFTTKKIIKSHRDTSDLNTKEFAQFIESCRAFYEYEMGEEIPLPNFLE